MMKQKFIKKYIKNLEEFLNATFEKYTLNCYVECKFCPFKKMICPLSIIARGILNKSGRMKKQEYIKKYIEKRS